MSYIDSVNRAFKAHGWRPTVNIQNIAYLLDNTDKLLSPRQIGTILKQKANHKTDLSTVYRGLEKLKKLELVYEVEGKFIKNNAPEKSSASPHFLFCDRCGKVEEIFLEYDLRAITTQLQKEKGFTLNRMTINFHGRCHECTE